jgi:hypothetical protein
MSKKKSGWQRRKEAANGIPPAGVGRPKGVTEPIRQLQEDFEFAVKIPRWSDMDIAKALLQSNTVRSEKLLLNPCKYRYLKADSVRRLIGLMRSQKYEHKTPLKVREKNSKPRFGSSDAHTFFKRKKLRGEFLSKNK